MRERLDHIISKPLGRGLLVFSILAGIYLFIGKFIAGPVVDFTQGTLMGNW